MDEVSNKTLATLLVVAIVISLAGTFFAMRGVSQVTNIITGHQAAPPQSGTARVNITELSSIFLYQNLVDFGSGYRNASAVDINTECNLTTNDTSLEAQNGENGCWTNTSEYDPDPFVLMNDGNNYVNITINSSNKNNFINGSVLGDGGDTERRYQWSPSDISEGFFKSDENGCNVSFDGEDVWTEFSEVPQLVCQNMSPFDAEDTFNIDINISIPAGPIGVKTATVTFYAVKSAQ